MQSTTDSDRPPFRPVLTVIAPCYNEEGNVDPLTRRLAAALSSLPSFELVFIDDGSTDDTAKALADVSAAFPSHVRVGSHLRNAGIENAWRTGLALAQGEYICFIDSDLQNQPEDVPKLLSLLRETGADLAQGIRIPASDTDRSRLILSKGLNLLLNVVFGMALRDNKSGFLVAKREVFDEILRHRYRYRYFQCLVAVAAHARGFQIAETPTVFDRRLSGQSFMGRFPLRVVLGCLRDVAVGFLEFRLRGVSGRV